MHTFTTRIETAAGLEERSWTIRLTNGVVEKIKADLGVDLLDPSDEDWAAVVADTAAIVRIIWICICRQHPLFDPEDNSTWNRALEDWGDQLDGESIGAAIEAFQQELVFFIQTCRPQLGGTAQAALAKVQEIAKKVSQMGADRISQIEADTHLADLKQQIDGDLSGGSAPSQESIGAS